MSTVVAHVVHWPKSGIGTIVRQLVQFDRARRFNYVVIFLQSDTESITQFAQLGVTVVPVSIAANPLTAAVRIRRCLRSADIVHTHSFLPQLLGVLLSRKRSRQVRTVHNPYPYFSATDLRSKIKRFIEGLLITRSRSDLVSVSSETHRALPWDAPPGAISTIIENGIALEPQTESNRQGAAPTRPPGFLFVALGRLEHQKGFDILLDAMSLLRKQRTESPVAVSLWIIGDGSCRRSLEEQANLLQLDNVTFVGYQTAPSMFLAQGDAFVLPSRFEGLSLAAIEALALELPIILTDIGGIATLLQHGENAHIVPKENAESLADALLALVTRGEYRDRLARNGKAFVESHFSIEKCAGRYADVYSRER
jgi:glycosyltransferase involved in cell wall biosynthesis